MMKQLPDQVLEYLDKNFEVNTLVLAREFNEDHQKIIGAVKSLEAAGDLITTTPVTEKKWELTEEGQHVLCNGSHEAAVYYAVPPNGISQPKIMAAIPYAKIGFSKALAAGWIEIDKSGGTPLVKKKVEKIEDSIQQHLKDIENIPPKIKVEYKKRKLLQEVVVKSILLGKGPNFSTKIEKLEADLTADLLVNGAWKEKKFKPYNFAALGSVLEIGHLHPLLKVRSEFRKIFIEMGFTEMPTNNYVESSFWNFDALFQPQQHPARDAHDTFFVSDPKTSRNFPMDYLERVKKVHSKGGYGSQGYGYDWKIKEAEKNLLRTHTTAVSARMLYKLMKEDNFRPAKYFSIDRVFRNETLDATHLAEFHQIEGLVVGHNLTLGHLIGTVHEFFNKLGITQLRFKPAYNPYTEPSMEVFCYHKGLGKWIEIGNSGMFRPEMLLPMGFPEDVRVIAWGLSLERPTMIKYGLNNIRDLVGPKVDMEMVYSNPICRLDKIIPRSPSKKISEGSPKVALASTKCQSLKTMNIEKKLVIFCDPNYPIHFLGEFLTASKLYMNISVSTHVHSTVKSLSSDLTDFCSLFRAVDPEIEIVVIWKNIGIDPVMHIKAQTIMGLINIARYLNRILESIAPDALKYESLDILHANTVDYYLEKIHETLHTGKALQIKKKSKFAVGETITIVDVILNSLNMHNIVRK